MPLPNVFIIKSKEKELLAHTKKLALQLCSKLVIMMLPILILDTWTKFVLIAAHSIGYVKKTLMAYIKNVVIVVKSSFLPCHLLHLMSSLCFCAKETMESFSQKDLRLTTVGYPWKKQHCSHSSNQFDTIQYKITFHFFKTSISSQISICYDHK